MCAACVTHPPNVALYGVTPTSTPPTVLSQEIVCLGRWHRCPYNGILEQMSPSKCCKTQLLLEAFGFLFVHWLDWTYVLCQRLRKPSSPSFVQSSTKHGPSSPSGPSGPGGPSVPECPTSDREEQMWLRTSTLHWNDPEDEPRQREKENASPPGSQNQVQLLTSQKLKNNSRPPMPRQN